MTIFFGLLSAFSYGFADFFGALAAKKVKALTVTASSFVVGLAVVLLASPFIGFSLDPETIRVGILAGVCSAIAISCLYAALALGPISIVSPLTAAISAVVPVSVDVATGQELSELSLVAVAMLLVAVVLVGFVPSSDLRLPSPVAMLYSLGAGLGFAGIFIFLDSSAKASGVGPLITMRITGIVLLSAAVLLVSLKTRSKVLEPGLKDGKVLLLIAAAGSLDSIANISFLVATREGALAVAAVLTALYPVGTIVLARLVLKERIARTQTLGIAIAMAACALLALS